MKTLDIAIIEKFFSTFSFQSPSQRPIYTVFACKYVRLLRLFCNYSLCFYTIFIRIAKNIWCAIALRRYLARQNIPSSPDPHFLVPYPPAHYLVIYAYLAPCSTTCYLLTTTHLLTCSTLTLPLAPLPTTWLPLLT